MSKQYIIMFKMLDLFQLQMKQIGGDWPIYDRFLSRNS